MPLPAESLPSNPRALWEAIRGLQRRVDEQRASRNIENTSLSRGAITATGVGGQHISLTPESPVGVPLPDGTVIYPPAVTLSSSGDDLAEGVLTTYRQPTETGSVPVAWLVSPQTGPDTAGLTLQGGEEGGQAALAILAAAGATLALTPTGLTVTLANGAVLSFTAAGITAPGDITPGWNEDPNNRTSTSTTYGDATSGAFAASVVVPATGRVAVSIRCTQRASASNLNAITSWRAVGSTSGTVYTENDAAALITGGINNWSLSLRHLLTGLAPGETLTATIKHRLNAAGTQTLAYRSIILEP